jgi:PAS domain S-box-containing protein
MANNACAGLLGYNSVKALIAEQKMSDLYFDKGQRKKLLNKLHKSGRVENYEIELKLKDGRHVWVSTHLHMVCNGKCIEGTLIDITSHKQMEHRLEQMSKSYLIKMQKLSADIDAKITEFGELPMPLKTAGFTVST